LRNLPAGKGKRRGTSGTTHADGNVKLEGSRQLVVLYRLEAKQVVKIRVASDDCALDAGGLPFIWLTGVKTAESVALLTTYVRGSGFEDHGDRSVGNGALTAIALHADASADRALESFVTPEQREELRRQARILDGGRAGQRWIDRFAAHGENRSEFGRARARGVCAFREPRS